jgi:eukaryotic-like serine/threonine-protein kinase
MQASPGTRLGRYEIRGPIGKGGMGEVYLAHDNQLDRNVALKILPPALASQSDRMQRFIQEARTASALNHPNILTIHEIGQSDSTHFIATEFVDGVTLRNLLKDTLLSLRDAFDIFVQLCSALAVAHSAAVVHRDIKPENVMLRTDGYVKVLDFGLAKLIETRGFKGGSDPHAPTEPQISTEPGVVMGTVNYMSPEQARGLDVDERTDIWACGVVLYEMLTGRIPFSGATSTDVVACILEREPPPLKRYAPNTPDELGRIVSKALAKDREERYQTIKDLLIDVRRLKRQLEADAERQRLQSPGSDLELEEDERIDGLGQTPSSRSTAEYLTASLKRHKRGAVYSAIVLIIAVGAIGYCSRRESTTIDSLAVLPFVTVGTDADMEFMATGLTENIVNTLAGLPNLRVVPQSMVAQYKAQGLDSVKVGGDLGVRAVLTGQVSRRGDILLVKIDLVDVVRKRQLMVKGYNRTASDVLGGAAISAMQEDISKQVTDELKLKLAAEY